MTPRATARPVASSHHPHHWVHRSLVVLCVVFSAGLLLLQYQENTRVAAVRGALTDALMPLVSVVSEPVHAVRGMTQWVGSVLEVQRENQRLLQENARLKQWMHTAQQLQQDNEMLREQLRVVPQPHAHFVTARTVADSRGPFAQSVVINAGAEQGVALHQAVMGVDGLLGRVVEVSPRHARVLLVSDINSRIPVVGLQSQSRAVLVGSGGRDAGLRFVSGEHALAENEPLVTTATGSMPAGLPVGHVTAADERAQLHTADSGLDYVRVIQYTPLTQP